MLIYSNLHFYSPCRNYSTTYPLITRPLYGSPYYAWFRVAAALGQGIFPTLILTYQD